MSYAVVRMQKMKSHNLKGMQFHNQRERKSKTNPDIEEERTHENYDLKNEENIDYNKEVRQIIEEQKISERKTRKDAVLVNEFIITSDRDFFDNLDSKEENRFFKETYDLFTERYGEQNVAYAMVHKDESTPHMHLGVVPMRDGKLQGKNVFNRQELLWLQDNFPKHMQEKGFDLERGERGSEREHLPTQEFKKQQLETVEATKKLVSEQVNSLESELKAKKQELSALNEKVPDADNVETRFKKQVKSVEVPTGEKTFFGKEKTMTEKKPTGKVIIPEKTHKQLVKAAKENQRLKGQMDNMLSTDLVKENRELKSENRELEESKRELGETNKVLMKENTSLKSKISDLTNEIENVYEHTKDFLKSRTNDLQAFKEVFGSWVDKFKEKLPKGQISRLDEQSKAKEKQSERKVSFNMKDVAQKDKEIKNQQTKNKAKSKDMEMEL